MSGIRVGHVKWAVYALCGGLAALGGIITSSKLGSGAPTTGQGAELDVIASVVVGGVSLSGGRGTMVGTFVGLLIVSVLGSGLNWVGVETFGQQVILGVVILAAVLLDRVKGREPRGDGALRGPRLLFFVRKRLDDLTHELWGWV